MLLQHCIQVSHGQVLEIKAGSQCFDAAVDRRCEQEVCGGTKHTEEVSFFRRIEDIKMI